MGVPLHIGEVLLVEHFQLLSELGVYGARVGLGEKDVDESRRL